MEENAAYLGRGIADRVLTVVGSNDIRAFCLVVIVSDGCSLLFITAVPEVFCNGAAGVTADISNNR